MKKKQLDQYVKVLEHNLKSQYELEKKHGAKVTIQEFDGMLSGFVSGVSCGKENFTETDAYYICRAIEKKPIAKKYHFGRLCEETYLTINT